MENYVASEKPSGLQVSWVDVSEQLAIKLQTPNVATL